MKMMKNMNNMRKAVLFLLFLTVLSPILLFTDTFSSSSSSNHFNPTTLAFGGDTLQLNLLPQETTVVLKEPIGSVYSDKSVESRETKPAKSVQEAEVLQVQPVKVEHKNRVLSTTTIGSTIGHANQQNSETIRQVTDGIHSSEDTTVNVHAAAAEQNNLPLSLQNSQINSSARKITPKLQLGERGSKTEETVDAKPRNVKDSNQVSMPNTQVQYLKDQLIRAKVYLSLTATRNNAHFIRDLRQRIKEVQRVLGDATKDSELPRNTRDKLKAMDQTLAKGKQIQDDCAAMVKKLRAIIHSTEEQLRVHRKQTTFLSQLTAKTLPKGLHCLPLRLSTEYYALNYSQKQFPQQEKLDDPELYHYALFSDNILAAAVVVNSTISHAKDPSKHVFHIVTDRLNFAAMRMWFLVNQPGKAAIHVQNVEEFTWLNSSYSPVLKQLGSPSMIDYYFKTHRASSDSNLKFRNPKYLSILNHLRFYLPEIFPKLKKVLFLDDDIVVQKDLSALWSTDLKGNVNGAVENCGETFHRFDRYLNFSNPLISKTFDPHACGWAYGMNIFDLEEWKRQNITEVYHTWQKLNHDRQLWKLGTLPPGLITFWKRTHPLDRSWHVLGLGYNPNVNSRDIEKAAVIHYNGNMKPWLEIAISKFRHYWSKYVDYDHLYLRECNINP
ncbi:putative galacturonosyltransferase 4 [Silene latifolia]|uniref:putative galacturonosyltransferase 4 n=1 Tax=Silene latifolia TaxID=37657 RepID=UPI003D7832D7